MTYVSLVKTSKGIYLLWADDAVVGWKTEKEALDYYEEGYRKAHLRSYEGSMSACINWLFLHPSIIEVGDVGELFPFVVHDEDGAVQIGSLWSVAGGMEGLECNEDAEQLWEKGTKPRLIDNQWLVDNEIAEAKEVLKQHGELQ